MKLKLLLFFCLISPALYSQNSTGGVVHFRYVGPTATFIDQPCGPADIAFATDVLPGSNLFMCPVENQWTQMLSTASSIANWTVVGVGPAANAPATCTARQDAYITTDTQQILYCFATDVFTALPAQSSCANCAIVNGPNTYVGDYLNDFSTSELGLPRHSTDPATCLPGQLEFNSIGTSVKYCSAPNTWSTLTVGTVITGTATFLPVFTGPTNLGNSAVTDDGVTVRTSENVSLGQNSLMSSYPNSSSGTVAYTLTKLDNSGNAIQILTTDTTAIYGICVIGCAPSGTSATALIAVAGQVQCLFDNQTVVRDFITASTGVAGDCHDAGSTEPTGVQVVGRVVNLNAGTGTTATIALFSPDTAQASPPVVTFQVANANPGTVLNSLVKLTGAPSTGTVTATTDTSGYIGICSGGCGNSGNATIIQQGSGLCVFDGATTAGDYVQISSTNAGQCHDSGAGYPVPGDVVGRVLTTNGGTGTYGIAVFPPESSNPVTATIAAGTINDVVKYTGANAIGPSGVTIDSSNNVATPGSVTTGTGGADSGSIVFNGHTSGGQGFGVLDVAGSAILYLLPTTPTTGDVLQDSGVVTCPTLPVGAPSVCHQLVWVSGSGALPSGTADQVFVIPHAGGTAVFGPVDLSQSAAVKNDLAIANGGTGAGTAAAALINLFPTATRVGDIIYCSAFSTGACTAWSLLAGNNSGTQVLQETSGGVPSWAAAASGTVNAGTASHLAYYATSTNAVSDMGADFTFATHTLSGGASSILNLTGSSHTLPVQSGTTAGKPATCTVGELYFATDATAGQNIYECSATNTWTQQLDTTSSAGGIISYSGPSLSTVSGTIYCPSGGGGTCSSTESNVDLASSSQATITNLSVQLSGAIGAGNSVAITWRKNNADQSSTCTISGASQTECQDTSHSFNVSQGDLLDYKLVFGGTVLVNPFLSAMSQFGTTQAGGTVNSGGPGLAYYAAVGTAVSSSGNFSGIPTANGASAPTQATGHNVAAILTCATSSNSGTAETCSTSPTFTPAAGDSIIFQADIANTGAFTLNANSLGAKSVKKNGTTALVANDILASPFQVLLTYDGTNWEMQGQTGNASGTGGGCTATKYTVTQSPFGTTWTVTGQSGQSVTASTTTQTINIVTLASKTVINWLRIATTTKWAGTSMTNYTMSLGTNASGGSTTSFEPAFTVGGTANTLNADSPFGACTASCPTYLDDGGSFSGADNGETVTATFISTGGNLTATTAGSEDVTICTSVLP